MDSRKPLELLFGAVALLLLITVSNVASLVLAQLKERERELAIRSSLGATQAQVDAIAFRQLAAPCFSDLERTVLRFTEQVVEKVRADEPLVREALGFLSQREIVELIMTIGFYMTAARITETTRTDLDPPAGTKVIDQIRRAR